MLDLPKDGSVSLPEGKFLWFSNGFPMVFQWFSNGFPMVFHDVISPQMDALVGKLVDLPSKPSRRRDRRARGLERLETQKWEVQVSGSNGPTKVPRINEALINEVPSGNLT